MKKMRYFFHKNRYLILSVSGREDGMLDIDFGKGFDGKLLIGTVAYKIENGRTVIDSLPLKDGIQELFVIRDKKTYPAEGFGKHGNKITLSPLSDLHSRELLCEYSSIKEKLAQVEALYNALSDKIAHTTIF